MIKFTRFFLVLSLLFGGFIVPSHAAALLYYQKGPRLIDGSQLNLMVDVVNAMSGNGGTLQPITGTTGTFSGALTAASDTVTGTLTARSATATPAAAAAVPALSFGSAGIAVYWGTGAPTISAAKGSLYIQTDGNSTSTRLYINNGTTTWIAITTAS